MSSTTEIAWAAGLFEGEGCFSLRKAPPRRDGLQRVNILVTLNSTDLDVLERFRDVVGVGSITHYRNKTSRNKEAWIWQLSNHEGFLHFLRLMMPWLCERRRNRALEVLSAYDEQPVRRVSKTHCPHGHEFTEENTLRVNGWRRCRECNRISQRKQTMRRKEIAS